jgi:hypothetical protein
MATQTRTNDKLESLFDVQGAVERWADATRQAANNSLDLYEKTVDQLADAEITTARAVKIPAIVKIAETHAALSREVTGAYVTTVRELLKA